MKNDSTPQTSAGAPSPGVGSSDLFGEGSGCVERVRANVHRLEGRGGEDVRGLLTIIDRLRAELAEERDASEVERVVDAMTPEQVEAYIVKMGGDITEVRARGQKLRAKIAAQMEGDGPVSNATARAYLKAYSATPRTDARCADSQKLQTMAMRFAWMCDFARKLEIELAQCRADKSALKRELLGEEPRGDFPNGHPTEYDSP